MTFEIGLVSLIIVTIILLFVFEVFPVDKIAFCTIGVLIISGLITPEEAISGFSNTAVITILCLMIIATALEQNGVIAWLANSLKVFKDWHIYLLVPTFMLIAGSISAFISSTAVVIVFIKIITELSDKFAISKSKLLLPISFASILGGSCTLMGTSTNLIVNSIYQKRVGERLSFFEFSWLGLIFLIVSIVIITLLVKFLPKDSTKKLRDEYSLDTYIATIELAPNSKLIGKHFEDSFLHKEDIIVLKFVRNGKEDHEIDSKTLLKKGDRFMLSCDLENLLNIKSSDEVLIASDGIEYATFSHKEFKDYGNKKELPSTIQQHDTVLVELMMLPGARFLNKSLEELRAIMPHNALPIAIKKRKNLRHLKDRLITNLSFTKLKVGDRVLLEIEKNKIEDFDIYDNMVILQEHESPKVVKSPKRTLTLFILLGVIVLAATGTLKILSSTIIGCAALLLLNCISLENAYKKIDWQILILLAGMIPLGIAMNNSGTDVWLSERLLNIMHGESALYAIGVLFLSTLLLSGVISNNAAAIIMAPLAITISSGLQLPTKPFILAVMFASNFSFFTPVGYQTNALIYSMGVYKFKDFLILGGSISIVLWILATLLLNTMI
ncbi:SLC13 family permease [Algibacter sp. 2305UL17-15]|uniref:SLC13 family permease n=1 Tax=Algibacter sp. 2305UL17-15 TaxID=3231268 RepID=UPI003458DBF4